MQWKIRKHHLLKKGLVEQDPKNNFSGIFAWNYYDGSRIKSMLFPQFKGVIAEQQHVIIKRKLGAVFLEHYKQHQDTINMQPITVILMLFAGVF